jgi:ferredoxin-NADP reductase
VAGLAVASKYILAIRKKHIFNPAAVAVVLTAFGASQSASWWVGTSLLAPVVFVGGVLVVRKIKRGHMVITFLASALLMTMVYAGISGGDILAALQRTILGSSLLFLAFVMLTEPLTSPGTVDAQRWYGGVVGALFPPQVHLFSLYSTPELALLVGNALTYLISPHAKFIANVVQTTEWGPSVRDFAFNTGKFKFKPGQYMEFTLPHHGVDSRGARRFFTIASSPTEKNLHIGVKFYPSGSSYKRALHKLDPHAQVGIAGLGGDFVLPKDKSRKLAFIAGGIGVTPFRSMMKYLLDTGEQRDVVMIYSERTIRDLAYTDVFNPAQRTRGIKIVYTIADEPEVPAGFHKGMVTPEMIAEQIPDYKERLFYLSGPHPMVMAMQQHLASLGVPDSHVKTDFFPGYA